MEGLLKNYLRAEDEREGLKRERESSPLLEKKERLERSVRGRESELKSLGGKIEDAKGEFSEIQEQIEGKSGEIREEAGSLIGAEVRVP